MLITRRSIIDGVERTREIAVTAEQFLDWKQGTLIQNAMPNISDDDREFILTGITSDQWEAMFSDE